MAVELYLQGQSEKVAPENPYGIKPQLLYHQWRTADALRSSPLVMNVYNTGTGKTRASLLHLFDIEKSRDNHVLFIAPTNELLHQHVTDIQEFVTTHNLAFRVVEVNAKLLRELAAPELAIVNRQGERLTRLVRNPLEFKVQLGIPADDNRTLPTIFVTNPDLFYYAFFWQFNANDQRNLFEQFIFKFRYIVIDEFHYYNSKQLANFLFFMILSKELGYFAEHNRRICLLSATPDTLTRQFLDQIFSKEGWTLISPDNEPPEAATFTQVPTLAPLHLRIQTGTLEDFAHAEAKQVKQWLDHNEDGALISSALWRINSAHAVLRRTIPDEWMGRITGAQPVAERRRDQSKRLILATPTVDIGYNFIKEDKPRQNLDFVVFDARFRDEFVQRLGRAGRVLGKSETDTPSQAVALLDDEAVNHFTPLHGQQLTRVELRDFIAQQSAIPAKDDFVAYIRSGGLLENAYPLYKLLPMYAKEEQPHLEALFDTVRQIFAPSSSRRFCGVIYHYKRLDAIENWLRDDTRDPKKLGQLMAEFLGWATAQTVTAEEAEDNLPELLSGRDLREGFRIYCEIQRSLHRAQFSFRDSFSGPVAWVYDTDRLLSGANVTQYDLIHIVENYDYRPLTPAFFRQKTDEAIANDAICVEIQRLRQPRQRVSLQWRTLPRIHSGNWDKPSSFDHCFANGDPTAIKGLSLVADEQIPEELRYALEQQYVPALLVPTEKRGNLQRALAQRPVYPRKLLVRAGREDVEYEAILGSNALLMAPILRWVFHRDQRKEESAIIC